MEMNCEGYKGRKLKRVGIVPYLDDNNIKTFQFWMFWMDMSICWSRMISQQLFGRIVMKFSANIHGPKQTYSTDFDDA